jgi:hypothetical protein
MNYSKIISYIYTLLAVGLGTYFCITYIYYYKATLDGYYSKDKEETTAIIKTINCYDNSCYSKLEYNINGIKYMNEIDTPNLKIGDKIKIKYNPNAPNDANELRVYNNIYIYSFIFIILLIICIILLWIFLFIIILFSSNYDKFIFLFYSIFITIFISYYCYIIIHNNSYDLLNRYNDYENYTIGIIKSQDECYDNIMCFSNIEYLIDDIKHNVKLLTFYYKVGEEVKVYYNKDYPQDIKIYDKTENKRIIKTIIFIIILLLLWIFLFFNIPIIIK